MKTTFKNTLNLFFLNLVVQKRNFFEFLKVVKKYYSNALFRKLDLSIIVSYLFNSPFLLSKKFLKEKGEEDLYTYGETPLTSFEIVAKESQIQTHDTFFELGCGRGRVCFWVNSFLKCRVVGIEYVPEFVENANTIKERFKLKDVNFRLQDMLKTNFTGATVIYLYGTTLDSQSIKTLIEKFKQLPSGTKIITVSYPLTDYTTSSSFEIMKRFSVPFTWGVGDVYLHIKR